MEVEGRKQVDFNLNRDQGALHQVFMQTFASAEEMAKCDNFYFTAK